MSKNKLQELSDFITQYGIETAIQLIDIESIENLPIKIILRTIQTSHDHLLIELEEALS